MPPEASSHSSRTANEPHSNFVSVNGVKIHYLDWGGSGEPIIILHAEVVPVI